MFSLENGVLLLGVVLVTTSLLMQMRKRQRQATPRLSPREELERARQAHGLHGDLEEVMVEVEQLAKRFGTQLDAKSIQLDRMIRQADERIQTMQRLAENTGGHRQISDMTEVPSNVSARAGTNPSAASSTEATGSAEQQNEVDQQDTLARNIYALADAGSDPLEIAKQLDEHVGKVELILALRSA